ncbi:LacI family DNA-binding transcriptional regulator [uncultured Roseibium sp.]|uniref:LacI family DNA-binding transcriptional regulator n=1 Tax=uncultured Roseibium sp. TaxID=1936171 RepID=UPI00261C5A5E|nr:LacI family DNA-binding transcriptional regulator [uncultured Roseibium sp.]
MAPRPNLSDIARALGVSSATVSNALSGKGRVSAQLSRQIAEKARELGYVPSLAGRALSTGRSHVLGLVLADIGHPLFPQFAQAIEQAATKAGYGVLIGDSRGDVKTQTAAIDQLIERGADGIILVPRHGTRIAEINCPVAVIDTPSTPGNTVSADHWQGGRLIGAHLRDLGHTRLAVIGLHQDSNVQADRIGGIRTGFGPEGSVRTLWIDALEAAAGPGCELGLAELVRHGYTAFAAVSDIHALRAVSELQRSGLSVPVHVTVTGFDDLHWARSISPALTTVRMDMEKIARLAVADLLLQIEPDRSAPPVDEATRPQAVPMELVVRNSSASPNENLFPSQDNNNNPDPDTLPSREGTNNA